MTARVKQALIQGLKLAFAVGLIYWLVHQGAIDFTVLRRLATPTTFGMGAVLIFVSIYVNNYRWLLLLRAQGFDTTVKKTLPLSFIGMFFNYAMPGGVGGDVVKGYYLLQDHREQRIAGAVSILMDRILGFFMMITTAAFALFSSWGLVTHSSEMASLATGVILLFVAFMAFFAVALSRRVGQSRPVRFVFDKVPGGRLIERVYGILHSYRKTPRALAAAFLISLVSQFSLIVFVYMIAMAMNVTEIPFLAYCFLVPVGIVATAIPISPAGVGVGQAAFFFLFSLYLERESQVGATAITALQLMQFFWGLLGAYFYLRRGKPKMVQEAMERAV